MHVSKFIKENTSLCICTLGLAIVGYMGYYAVRWIINKCQKTEKVDRVARKHLDPKDKPLELHKKSSNPLITNRVSSLNIAEGKVNIGQGEYIVFHSLPSGEKKDVARETYDRVYKVLNEYAPAAIVNRNSDTAMEECENRYEIIKSKIKEIDPTLELVFVPRTLYELIFIRKCINEDLKHNKICDGLVITYHLVTVKHYGGDQKKFEEFQKDRWERIKNGKCWHLCYFDDVGDNDHPRVRDVAYRLNRVIAKTLSPKVGGFTHEELSKYAEKEIEFLRAHHQKGLKEKEKRQKGIKVDSVSNCSAPGPTTNFGYESYRGSIKPMGIRDDKDAQIIRDAIAIDCSEVAKRTFFLYRGADFQRDSVSCWSDKDKPYSLSFGSSLFAGCLFDGGATAFHYMRKGKNAYTIPVQFDQLNSSLFFYSSYQYFSTAIWQWRNFS